MEAYLSGPVLNPRFPEVIGTASILTASSLLDSMAAAGGSTGAATAGGSAGSVRL